MPPFAAADDPGQRSSLPADVEIDTAVETVRARGFAPRWVHEANSAAAHASGGRRGNLARLGGVLYGLWRDVTNPSIPPLDWRPVMSLHTRILYLKTVPAGSALGTAEHL